MFTGPLAWMLVRGVRQSTRPTARYACALLAVLVIGPYAMNTWSELRGIYGRNDMADEYALADYVRDLPPDQSISTTFYPVERTMNFLAGRDVKRIPAKSEALTGHALVIVDSTSQEMLLNDTEPVERFGRYVVLKESP